MIELALNNIEKYYGATKVLEDITFDINSNEKVGIVGGNGSGKSTLLKIIIGLEEYDSGVISVKKDSTLGYLEQVPLYSEDYKVIDVLNIAFEKVDQVYKELKLLEEKISNSKDDNMDKLLNIYSKTQLIYEGLGGYEKEEKLSKVCTGLKIDEKFKDRLFSSLSGGEKTTVILGKILLQNPDILLLDEPSNHLDLEAMEWLEAYIKEYKGIAIIVSHDRYFLDNVVTKIIEIDNMKSAVYSGNYSYYTKEKDKELELQLQSFMDQQKKIKSMENTIFQLRDWGSRGDNNKFFKRANSMEKMLNKIEKIKKPIIDKDSININSKKTNRSSKDVIILKDLSKSFGDKVLIKNADLLIRNGERVGLLGANGSGKTTLIKILLDTEKPDSGEANLGSSIKLGYLPQNIKFKDENSSILDCFREDILITEGRVREYLAKYMFYGEEVFKKVGSLSGGERSRLVLSKIMYNEVNLLILDEPTNHLDIDSRESLEEFLESFQGTIFFVSHDRYFINSIAKRIVDIYNGDIISYEGNYEYYKEKKKDDKIEGAPKKEIKNKKTYNHNNQSNNKKKKVKEIELVIEELGKEIISIEAKIEMASSDYVKLNDLYNEKNQIENKIEKLMEEYFSMQ